MPGIMTHARNELAMLPLAILILAIKLTLVIKIIAMMLFFQEQSNPPQIIILNMVCSCPAAWRERSSG
jgi:hypothetical protein